MMELKRSFKPTTGGLDQKKKKKWLKPALIGAAVVLLVGGIVAWRTGSFLNKISTNGNILGSLVHMIPGVNDSLQGEKEGRVNILLLGMRGEHLTGGGLLADTIMVASFDQKDNKISLLSIPRDLYVQDPGRDSKSKINAVYAYGEERKQGGGMEDMKKVVGDIVGAPIPYALVINFQGFTDLVDKIGGVEVDLKQPFEEALQFNEEHECDANVFTKPSGNFETKKRRTDAGKIRFEKVQMCTNPDTECGGDFKLPAGKQTLSGEQALCFARSRKTTSDFERAKRQQLIIQQIKQKALATGTLTDFNKVNGIINSLGDNIKTDMQAWELKRLYDLESSMQSPQVIQKVLENSDEGLLYTPEATPETGYILAPIGDNYDKIHDLFKNVFNSSPQSDINPK